MEARRHFQPENIPVHPCYTYPLRHRRPVHFLAALDRRQYSVKLVAFELLGNGGQAQEENTGLSCLIPLMRN